MKKKKNYRLTFVGGERSKGEEEKVKRSKKPKELKKATGKPRPLGVLAASES